MNFCSWHNVVMSVRGKALSASVSLTLIAHPFRLKAIVTSHVYMCLTSTTWLPGAQKTGARRCTNKKSFVWHRITHVPTCMTNPRLCLGISAIPENELASHSRCPSQMTTMSETRVRLYDFLHEHAKFISPTPSEKPKVKRKVKSGQSL